MRSYLHLLLLALAACSVNSGASTPPPTDGGSDGRSDGGCVRTAERCNGADDDCDGMIDERFDLERDPENCGSCGTACTDRPNAPAACAAGACVLRCDPGFEDCNGDPGDGCEAPEGSVGCVACGPDAANCDMNPDNGCETRIDTLTDCGACGAVCAPANADPVCRAGACGFTSCDAGFDNCDGNPINGCEADLGTSASCGSCENICGSWQSCSGVECLGCPPETACRTGCSPASPCNCGDSDCRFACGAGDCVVDCGGEGRCTVEAAARQSVTVSCSEGCGVDANGAETVDVTCNEGCDVDCRGATSCRVDCRGGDGSCDVRCDSGACDIVCGGSILECGDVRRCGAEEC